MKTKTIEVVTLQEAYAHRGYNKTKLAIELGLQRNTLRNHLECGGHQLLHVNYDDNGFVQFKYVNKGWTK